MEDKKTPFVVNVFDILLVDGEDREVSGVNAVVPEEVAVVEGGGESRGKPYEGELQVFELAC